MDDILKKAFNDRLIEMSMKPSVFAGAVEPYVDRRTRLQKTLDRIKKLGRRCNLAAMALRGELDDYDPDWD